MDMGLVTVWKNLQSHPRIVDGTLKLTGLNHGHAPIAVEYGKSCGLERGLLNGVGVFHARLGKLPLMHLSIGP